MCVNPFSNVLKSVALLDCVDGAILLPTAPETGQVSPELYLILKMLSDPAQGPSFLIRLQPRLCPDPVNYIFSRKISCQVSDNSNYIILAKREMWIMWGLRYHKLICVTITRGELSLFIYPEEKRCTRDSNK